MKTKTVYIRRKNPNTKVPDFLHKEATKKLSAVWSGNGTLRGLTAEEERKYLPKVLGVSVNSQDWEREVRDYWLELSVDIPSGEGYQLTIDYQDDGEPFDDINNIRNYIILKFAQAHPKCAPDENSLRGNNRKIFYIYDPVKKAEQDARHSISKSEAMKVYLSVYQDKAKVHQVLTVLDYMPETLTEDEITTTLLKEFEKDSNKFVRTVEDKKLEIKYFIASLVKANIIKLDEGVYFDSDRSYGTIDKFIMYLDDPINSQQRMMMEAKVEGLTKQFSKFSKKSTSGEDDDDNNDDFGKRPQTVENPFKDGAPSLNAKPEDIKSKKKPSDIETEDKKTQKEE